MTKFRDFLRCYWPVLIFTASVILTAGMWLQRTAALETTVRTMTSQVGDLSSSTRAIDRAVRENREDTRMILDLLLRDAARSGGHAER